MIEYEHLLKNRCKDEFLEMLIFLREAFMVGTLSDNLREITANIIYDYSRGRDIDKLNINDQPSKDEIIETTDKLLRVIFPGYFKNKHFKSFNVQSSLNVLMEDTTINLREQIATALKSYHPGQEIPQNKLYTSAEEITLDFLKTIPHIREFVDTDVQAALEGDPAAENTAEIIVTYPGLYAISVYRLAHELYVLGVPIIPRIMTEYAHSQTGIDINPGAKIGKYFFIDHGTGVVIGETTIIGEHVKVYQGVTLGALSTRGGRTLRNVKRHPTIEDYVTIYSGASILGGETVIGEHSVIGGNVFITSPIAPFTKVSVKNQELKFDLDKRAKDNVARIETLGPEPDWFYSI